MDILDEMRARFPANVKIGSSAWVWAWRKTIDQCYADGVIVAPPVWHGARKVTVQLPGQIRCVDIKLVLTGGTHND